MDVHQQIALEDKLIGSTITALSMRKFQITVKLEATSYGACLICKNATLLRASMDYISILRLCPEERCVTRVHTIILEKDMFLLFVLSGGEYVIIRAEDVSLRCSCEEHRQPR